MPRTFGEEATAIRTGWRWSCDHAAYIRIAALANGNYRVEAATPGNLSGTKVKDFGAWWESNVILWLIQRLEKAHCDCKDADAKQIQGYECWEVGADGRTVSP